MSDKIELDGFRQGKAPPTSALVQLPSGKTSSQLPFSSNSRQAQPPCSFLLHPILLIAQSVLNLHKGLFAPLERRILCRMKPSYRGVVLRLGQQKTLLSNLSSPGTNQKTRQGRQGNGYNRGQHARWTLVSREKDIIGDNRPGEH